MQNAFLIVCSMNFFVLKIGEKLTCPPVFPTFALNYRIIVLVDVVVDVNGVVVLNQRKCCDFLH